MSTLRPLARRILVVAAALAAIVTATNPLTAQAAPVYRYTYTSQLYTEPASIPPDFLTFEILSPVQLTAGLADLALIPGLSVRGWDSNQSISSPASLPFHQFGASIFFYAMEAGLPTQWDASVDFTYSEPFEWSRWGTIATTNNGNDILDRSEIGNAPSGTAVFRNIGTPGTWSLEVRQVPEPGTLVLAGAAITLLVALRFRKRRPPVPRINPGNTLAAA